MNFNKNASTLRVSFTWRKGVLAQLCFVLFFSLARYLLYNMSWFLLYINMNQPQVYIYILQIYLRNTVDSVSDHYNKANITKKKKTKSHEFFVSPVLPRPPYLRMVKTFIHV